LQRYFPLLAVSLLAGISLAGAAPNIPSSELPGRERQRFMESPVERFMNTPREAEPLIRWQCPKRAARRAKKGQSKRVRGGC
jgi:hypothetical protein